MWVSEREWIGVGCAMATELLLECPVCPQCVRPVCPRRFEDPGATVLRGDGGWMARAPETVYGEHASVASRASRSARTSRWKTGTRAWTSPLDWSLSGVSVCLRALARSLRRWMRPFSTAALRMNQSRSQGGRRAVHPEFHRCAPPRC